MKKIIYISTAIFLISINNINSQAISAFEFDSYPLTQASSGANAVSINPDAATDGEGVYMTTTGNTLGIDLEIPGSAFNVESITLSFDYVRRENEVTFFRRDGLILSMAAGKIRVQYQTLNGPGTGTVTYDYPDVYTVPNNTRFILGFTYDKATGIASLYNNTTLVWTFDGPNSRALKFFGGNAFVGEIMDGTGSTSPSLYSFRAFPVADVTLPVKLVSFDAKSNNEKSVKVEWTTAEEQNNAYFEIEHSIDGKNWESIAKIEGNGTVNRTISYEIIHDNPVSGNNYYRLKQVDFDGKIEYFAPVNVIISNHSFDKVSVYPNPVNGDSFEINVPENSSGKIILYGIDGRVLSEVEVNGLSVTVNRALFSSVKGLIYAVYTDIAGNVKNIPVLLN